MAYFTFEGKQVYYETYGEGRPLLLLNGIMMSCASWKEFIEPLSARNMLILVDMLDQGKSDKMTEAYDHAVQIRLVDALLYNLAQAVDIEPEPAAIEREIDNMMASMEQQLMQQGANMEMYLQYTGRSMQEMREGQREQAKFGAKVSAALDQIVELEGITATEEDMEREFEAIAKECGISAEQVKNFFGEDSIAAVRQEICQKKAVAVIVANADITTVEV